MPNQLGKDVSSYFTSRELALRQSHWQVLLLVPSPQLGQYWAWIVPEGIMLKVPLTVPRAFYLNTKAPLNEDFPGRRMNKILPPSRPCFSLIKVVTDEAQFKAESRRLTAHLADPEVEGINETKIPLHYNAVLQIGCACKVDKSVKHTMSKMEGVFLICR